MTTTVTINLFSPRSGHKDKYTIILEKNIMTIKTFKGLKAVYEWKSDEDPTWSSDTLMQTLNRNNIYPPEILKNLLVSVWRSWVDNELNDKEAQNEFTELEKWVNAITEARPQSEYWKMNF